MNIVKKMTLGMCFGLGLLSFTNNVFATDDYAYFCRSESVATAEDCYSINVTKKKVVNRLNSKDITNSVSIKENGTILLKNGNYSRLMFNNNLNIELDGNVYIDSIDNIGKDINITGNGTLTLNYINTKFSKYYVSYYIYDINKEVLNNNIKGVLAIHKGQENIDPYYNTFELVTSDIDTALNSANLEKLYIVSNETYYDQILKEGTIKVVGNEINESSLGYYLKDKITDMQSNLNEIKEMLNDSQIPMLNKNRYINNYESISSQYINKYIKTSLNKLYTSNGGLKLSNIEDSNNYKDTFVNVNNDLNTKITVVTKDKIDSKYSLIVEYNNDNQDLIKTINKLTGEVVYDKALYNIYFVDELGNKVKLDNNEYTIEIDLNYLKSIPNAAVVLIKNDKLLVYPATSSTNKVLFDLDEVSNIAIISDKNGIYKDNVVEILADGEIDLDEPNKNEENKTDEIEKAPQTFDNIILTIIILSILISSIYLINKKVKKIEM